MITKPLLIVTTLIIIFALEGPFPHYGNRKNRLLHAVPHVLTALINALLTRAGLSLMTVFVLTRTGAQSWGLMNALGLSGAIRTVIALILFDGWMYLWHLANHRMGFFWRFHRAHHADIEMDTTTALRFHPGELILSSVMRLPIVILIGMSFAELVLFEIMLNISTLFHHSNLAVPEKWDRMLRVVVTTPNMHRVHHSIELSEMNSNFTSLLSFWDRLFRTFRISADSRSITLGLPLFREGRFQRFWGFLITPFL